MRTIKFLLIVSLFAQAPLAQSAAAPQGARAHLAERDTRPPFVRPAIIDVTTWAWGESYQSKQLLINAHDAAWLSRDTESQRLIDRLTLLLSFAREQAGIDVLNVDQELTESREALRVANLAHREELRVANLAYAGLDVRFNDLRVAEMKSSSDVENARGELQRKREDYAKLLQEVMLSREKSEGHIRSKRDKSEDKSDLNEEGSDGEDQGFSNSAQKENKKSQSWFFKK